MPRMQKRGVEADSLSKAPYWNYLQYLIATSCTCSIISVSTLEELQVALHAVTLTIISNKNQYFEVMFTTLLLSIYAAIILV